MNGRHCAQCVQSGRTVILSREMPVSQEVRTSWSWAWHLTLNINSVYQLLSKLVSYQLRLTEQHDAHSKAKAEICGVANNCFTTWPYVGGMQWLCCVIVHTGLRNVWTSHLGKTYKHHRKDSTKSDSVVIVLLYLYNGYDAVYNMSYLYILLINISVIFPVWSPEAEMIMIMVETNDSFLQQNSPKKNSEKSPLRAQGDIDTLLVLLDQQSKPKCITWTVILNSVK